MSAMKSTAEGVLESLLAKVRRDLYREWPERWYAQQKMVTKALLHPAACLDKLAVEIAAARYQEICEGIIDTIAAKGNLRAVTYMSRYFYFCVQEHMKKNGDTYYGEGKAIRNSVSMAMGSVEKARRGADGTVPLLAQANSLLHLGKRKAGTARKDSPAPKVEVPRKIRSDALLYKLSEEQKIELANLVMLGGSYRKLVEVCAGWGIKTSLGALSQYFRGQ